MTMIAGCPRCSTELLLPDATESESSLECPVCGAKFARTAAVTRRLPQARVVADPLGDADPAVAPSTGSAGEPAGKYAGDEADQLESLSARLRSLQAPASLHLGEEHGSSMERLLGGRPAAPTEAVPDLEPAPDETDSQPLRTYAEAARDDDAAADVSAGEISAEIDSMLKAAADEAEASAPTPEAPAMAESPVQFADESPTERTESAPVPPESTEFLRAADESAEPPADDTLAPEPETMQADDETRLQQLIQQFMVEPPADAATADEATPAASVASGDDATSDTETAPEPFALPDFADDAAPAARSAANSPPPAAELASAPALETRPRPRRRRGRPVRMAAGIVGFGAAGVLAGGYALLWLAGPRGDVLHLASVLPEAMLPAGMRSEATLADHSAADQPAADLAPTNDSGGLAGALADRFDDNDVDRIVEAEPPAVDEALDDAAPLATADAPSYDTPRPDAAVEPASASVPVAPPAATDHVATVAASLGIVRPDLEQLTAAISQGETAAAEFAAGNLADRQSVARMGRAYMDLAQMVQAVTLAAAQSDANTAVTQKLLGRELFHAVARPDSLAPTLNQIAGRWLEYADRGNQGVILRGRVRDMTAVGKQTMYELEFSAGEEVRRVAVLSDETNYPLDAGIAVAGVIVPPQASLEGLPAEGELPVVLAGMTLQVEDPAPTAVTRGLLSR